MFYFKNSLVILFYSFIMMNTRIGYSQSKGIDCVSYDIVNPGKIKPNDISDYKPLGKNSKNYISKEEFCYIPIIALNNIGLLEVKIGGHGGSFFIVNGTKRIYKLDMKYKGLEVDKTKTRKIWMSKLKKAKHELNEDIYSKIIIYYDDKIAKIQ